MSRSLPLWVAAAFLVAAAVVDFVGGLQLGGVYATSAVIASISGRSRATAVVSGLAVTTAVMSGVWHGTAGDVAWLVRVASCAVAGGAAVVAARLAERYRQRLRHTSRLAQDLLDALAVELTGARTVEEVADAFLGEAAERLGVASAMIFVLDGETMRSVAWLGRGGPQADQYAEFPLSADLPGAVAARNRTPLHFRDRAAIEAAFPALAGYYHEERSLHVLPLVHGEQLQGLLALTFPPSAVSSDEERALLVSLAVALSAALSRAEALAAADAEVLRAAILAEASRSLSRSLDWDETLAEVSRLLVPDLADWCSLSLLRDGTLETVAVWHRDPATSAWAQTMRGVFPVDMSSPTGAPAVVRTGQPELYASIPEELVEASAVNEEHAVLLKRLGLVSAMVAPMRSEGTVTGAVSLAYAESGRRYDPADTQLLVDLASRIGTALDNAESYTRQSRRLTEVTKVAAAAQEAILSSPPPQFGPFELSARYVSAAEDAQVGGDLYEVVARGEKARILIGDVRGKGLDAIRTATIVLGGFRSTAVQDVPIEEVARHLDKHVQIYLDDEEDFVTAALVDLEQDGRFSVVLCGHPPPLVTHKGGWQLVGAAPSVPLGLGSTPEPVQGVLTPGDRMLLFTDGLLEARHPDGTFIDPEPLWSLAVTEPFPVLLDTLLGCLQSWTGGRLQDDLALLSIQYPGALEPRHVTAGPDPSAQRLTRVLPPETASVGVARRLVGRLLEETGRQGMVDDAQTAVSELMTNALVHTGSDIHLAATVTGSGLRVEIGDASPHAPLRRDYAATSATGRGLRIVEDVVTRWSSFPLGTGKVVWFEMEDPSGQPFATREPPPPATSPDQETVEVELQNVPLLMHAAWQEHTSALLREYLLVKIDEDMSVMGTHAAASDAMNLLYEQIPLPVLGDDPEMIMMAALEPHVSQPTLALRIPQASVHHFEVLDTMIREALELADTDRMFVPPTQPEIRDMCRWLCREVLEQAERARPPRPWSPREPVQVTHVPELTVPGFDPAEVTSSSRGLLAANEASVIVAVSPSMVEFLGYGSAAELVGRPLISVVPHRYRQAHVAGTTLHSVNGREPLLDVPLTVPVLRADGDESAVDLRVVSRSLPTGRRVFVAEFSVDRETGPAGGS